MDVCVCDHLWGACRRLVGACAPSTQHERFLRGLADSTRIATRAQYTTTRHLTRSAAYMAFGLLQCAIHTLSHKHTIRTRMIQNSNLSALDICSDEQAGMFAWSRGSSSTYHCLLPYHSPPTIRIMFICICTYPIALSLPRRIHSPSHHTLNIQWSRHQNCSHSLRTGQQPRNTIG